MLRFIDGFKHYSAADMTKKWSHVQGVTSYPEGGPTGGGYMRVGGIVTVLYKSFDEQRTWIAGFRHKWSGGGDQLHRFYYGAATQVALVAHGDGSLHVLNSSGAELGYSVPVLSLGVWRYVEMKAFISTNYGTVDVRVDGVDVINLTNVNTNGQNISAQTATSVGLGSWISQEPGEYTDYYVCDAQGSLNNDFLGDVEVQTLYPNGVGNNSQWLPLSGSNYENVDEATADGDTSYVYAATDGTIDTYEYDSMTAVSGVVHGIQHNIWARKAMSGSVGIAPVTRPNATDYTGSSTPLATSYVDTLFIEETNPDTGLTWTISEVNAAQFGQKVVA